MAYTALDFGTSATNDGASLKDTMTAIDTMLAELYAAGYQPADAQLDEWATVDPSENGKSLVAAANYAAMKALLDVESGTDFLSPSAIAAAYQPLDADLTALAETATTAAGRTILTATDPAADRLVAWDDSAGTLGPIALADILTEAAPAAGDYVVIYGAEGDVRKVNWSGLPGVGSGLTDIVDDATPQLGATLDANGFNIGFDDNTGILDDSGNQQLTFQKTASAVNEWEMTNAATSGKPTLTALGDDTNVTGRIGTKGTGRIEVKGSSTNDSPPAGYIGEVISSEIASGSAVSLTTITAANVTSISLTAGDWDVCGQVAFTFAGTTSYTSLVAAINTTSATVPSAGLIVSPRNRIDVAASVPGALDLSLPTGLGRLSLAATTTVYLVTRATFSVSTLAAYGHIWARRAS